MSDHSLVEKYIVRTDNPADAWVRGYGVDVWALLAYLRVVDSDRDQVAKSYELHARLWMQHYNTTMSIRSGSTLDSY